MSGWWEISRNVPMGGWGRVNTVRWRDSCHLDPVSVRPVLYRPADLLAVQVPVPAETHGGKPCLALSPSLSSPEFLYLTSRRGETPTQTVSDQWGQWGVPPVLSSVHSSDISQEERLTSPAAFQTSSENNISEWRHQWGIQVNVLVSSAVQWGKQNCLISRKITESICQNLHYNLAQLRSTDSRTYERLVDSVVVGPHLTSETEVETRLGIDCYHYHKSRKKRNSLRESKTPLGWEFEDDTTESNHQGAVLILLLAVYFTSHFSGGWGRPH